MMRMTAIAALCCLCLPVLAIGGKTADEADMATETLTAAETAPLYGTFEAVLTCSDIPENPFRTFRTVTFSDGKRTFRADAFYDGGNTWRVRFMPDREGTWTYAYSGEVTGKFTCTARGKKDRENHGHV
ncbi:MAG: DUF5060 domain-containing protein, partial [Planctomycetes bacterium]|nr:DUF5060 domain-containing protein [Planctomycetota bacterium]